MRCLMPALVVLAVMPVVAHHPFSPLYDGSKVVSVSGRVAELRIENPHVVVIIEGTRSDGRTGRWAFEGQSPNAFRAQGVKDLRTRLRAGTSVTISGWPAKDATVPAFSGREVTFANGTKMIFGPTPEQGDRWRCISPDPCGRYPSVLPQRPG